MRLFSTSGKYINNKICISCESNKFRVQYKNIIDGYSIIRCENCGIWILDPFPSDEARKQIYQDDYYSRWGYNSANLEMVISLKKYLYLLVLDEIQLYSHPAKILDIGCATGISLEAARERGWQPYGVEISEFAGKIAKEKFGNAVKIGAIEEVDFESNSFEAITMVDLFEHVGNPAKLLERLSKFLKNEGVLAIVTPDILSLSSRLMRKSWPHIKTEHLYYYSKNSIVWMLIKAGFKVELIKNFAKPITFLYVNSILRHSKARFIGNMSNFICKVMPPAFRTANFRAAIGEMLVIARKDVRYERTF